MSLYEGLKASFDCVEIGGEGAGIAHGYALPRTVAGP
jgi:hypothetical protein